MGREAGEGDILSLQAQNAVWPQPLGSSASRAMSGLQSFLTVLVEVCVCGEGVCAVGTGGCEVMRPHQQVALGRKDGGEGKWLLRNGQPQDTSTACGKYLKTPRNKWGRGVLDTCH